MMQYLQTDAYSNWLMVSPSGEEMCRCATKRANWYIDRGLAIQVSDNPPTIKLKFNPEGNGNEGDSYSLANKHNRCVVCGTEDELTKHHIIPSMYRKFLPTEIKGHSSHDVVIICVKCHNEYELIANDLKNDFLTELNISKIVHILNKETKDKNNLIKKCRSLKLDIPQHRKEEISHQILVLNKTFPTDEELEELSKERLLPPVINLLGKLVIEKILENNSLQDFVIRWRQHFLDNANPKYMPDFWDVMRKI